MHDNRTDPPHYYADDEIDLFELWNNLYQQKILIGAVTVVAAILGVAAALLIPSTYKTTGFFFPPLQQEIQSINLRDRNITYTVEEVYQRFIKNLDSRSLRKNYFDEHQLFAFYTQGKQGIEALEVFEEEFNDKLQLIRPGRNDDPTFYRLSFELTDAKNAAAWLNDFVDYVNTTTKKELIDEVNYYIQDKIRDINEEIASKLALAEQRREDEIIRLTEALQVANAVGLEDPMIDQAANRLNMEYMRGSRALQNEINVLKTRENDEPFVDGMRNLQERVAYLANITINPDEVRVVRIDQRAEVPYKPIKPNKPLIVLAALVLGLMLGVFSALIRTAIQKRRALPAQ